MKIMPVLFFFFISCTEHQGLFSIDYLPIIGGEKCTEEEFPASVEIWLDAVIEMPVFGKRRLFGPVCGGTVIASQVVLTAAHCLDPAEISNGFGKLISQKYAISRQDNLRLSKRSKKLPSGSVTVTSWIQHESYTTTRPVGLAKRADIGLLFLETAVSVQPIRWLQAEEKELLRVGQEVNIVGWGQQTVNASEQDQEKVARKMCAKTILHELADFEMQIGSQDESARKCYGDSGGATYISLPNGEQRLVGISSRSYDAEGCLKGGTDTRVDAYDAWIHQQLNMVDSKHGL